LDIPVIAGCGGRKRYIILYGEKVKRKKMEKSVFCSLLWPRHWVEGLLSAAARIGVHTAWRTMSLGGKVCPFQGHLGFSGGNGGRLARQATR
jgi:hypothetical protein